MEVEVERLGVNAADEHNRQTISSRKISEIGRRIGVPVIKKYKYLGTIIDSKLDVSCAMKVGESNIIRAFKAQERVLRKKNMRYRLARFTSDVLPRLCFIPLFCKTK